MPKPRQEYVLQEQQATTGELIVRMFSTILHSDVNISIHILSRFLCKCPLLNAFAGLRAGFMQNLGLREDHSLHGKPCSRQASSQRRRKRNTETGERCRSKVRLNNARVTVF